MTEERTASVPVSEQENENGSAREATQTQFDFNQPAQWSDLEQLVLAPDSQFNSRQRSIAHLIIPGRKNDRMEITSYKEILSLFERVATNMRKFFPRGLFEVEKSYREFQSSVEPWVRRYQGTSVFLDLSGSTHLGDVLVKNLGKRKGAEVLTEIFSENILPTADNQISAFEGVKIVIQGDAFLVTFLGEKQEERALAFAVKSNVELAKVVEKVRDKLRGLEIPEEEIQKVGLAYRTGIDEGNQGFTKLVYGSQDDPGFILQAVGKAFAQCEEISNDADRHEIAISTKVKERLESEYSTIKFRNHSEKSDVHLVNVSDRANKWDGLFTIMNACEGLDIAGFGYKTEYHNQNQKGNFWEGFLPILDEIETLSRYFDYDDAKRIISRFAKGEGIESEIIITERPIAFLKFSGLTDAFEKICELIDVQAHLFSSAIEVMSIAWRPINQVLKECVFNRLRKHGGGIEKLNVEGVYTTLMAFIKAGQRSPEEAIKFALEVKQSVEELVPIEIYVGNRSFLFELGLKGIGMSFGHITKAALSDRWMLLGDPANAAARAKEAVKQFKDDVFNGIPVIITESLKEIVDTGIIVLEKLPDIIAKGKGRMAIWQALGSLKDTIREIRLIGGAAEVQTFQTFYRSFLEYQIGLNSIGGESKNFLFHVRGPRVGSGSQAFLNQFKLFMQDSGIGVHGSCLPGLSLEPFMDIYFQTIDILRDMGVYTAEQALEEKAVISDRSLKPNEMADLLLGMFNTIEDQSLTETKKPIFVILQDLEFASSEFITVMRLIAEAPGSRFIITEAKYADQKQFIVQTNVGMNNLRIVNGTGQHFPVNVNPSRLEHIVIGELSGSNILKISKAISRVIVFKDQSMYPKSLPKAIFNKLNGYGHISNTFGNPYMIRLLLEDLYSKGILSYRHLEWRVDEDQLRKYTYPRRYELIIQEEFESMSADAQEVIYDIARLVGYGCTMNLLKDAYNDQNNRLKNGLEELNLRKLISVNSRDGENYFEFTNPYYAEIIKNFVDLQMGRNGGMERKLRLYKFINVEINRDSFSPLAAYLYKDLDLETAHIQLMKAASAQCFIYSNLKQAKALYHEGLDLVGLDGHINPLLAGILSEENGEIYEAIDFYKQVVENYIGIGESDYDLLALAGLGTILSLYGNTEGSNEIVNQIESICEKLTSQNAVVGSQQYESLKIKVIGGVLMKVLPRNPHSAVLNVKILIENILSVDHFSEKRDLTIQLHSLLDQIETFLIESNSSGLFNIDLIQIISRIRPRLD